MTAEDYREYVGDLGGNLDPDGFVQVEKMYLACEEAGATLMRGWPAGSKMNDPSGEKYYDMTCSGHDWSLQGTGLDVTVSEGCLYFEHTVDDGSHFALDEPIWTNEPWTVLILKARPTRVADFSENSLGIYQENAYTVLNYDNSATFNWVGSTSPSLTIGGTRNPVTPILTWLEYQNSPRILTSRDGRSDVAYGPTTGAGDFSSSNATLGSPAATFFPAHQQQYFGIFKFQGVLSAPQRAILFPAFYKACSEFSWPTGVYGNSNTNYPGGFVSSGVGKAWSALAPRGVYFFMPTGMGAKSPLNYRPADYEREADREAILPAITQPRDATYAVDVFMAGANLRVLAFLDDQNFVGAQGGNVLYSDLVHLRNAYKDVIEAERPGLRVIQTEMLPLAARQIGGGNAAMTYAEVLADTHRMKLLEFTEAVREDWTVTPVELWEAVNGGAPSIETGRVPLPATDPPFGAFPNLPDSGDPQHLTATGQAAHAELLTEASIVSMASEPPLVITFDDAEEVEFPEGVAAEEIAELLERDGGPLVLASDDALLARKLAEADVAVDKGSVPWQLVYREKGTSVVLMRKEIRDVDGASVTLTTTPVGRLVEP